MKLNRIIGKVAQQSLLGINLSLLNKLESKLTRKLDKERIKLEADNKEDILAASKELLKQALNWEFKARKTKKPDSLWVWLSEYSI